MGRVDNNVAMVTGASRGIGRAIAVRLAEEGADLAICDAWRDYESVPYKQAQEEDLAATKKVIESLGRKCVTGRVDVTKAAELEAFVDEIGSSLGYPSIAVANAGVASFDYGWKLTEQQWDDMLNVNLKGVWLTFKTVVPHMIEQGRGKLIAMSSIFGQKGAATWAHYCAAKFGVVGLIKAFAIELAPYEINVNALAPTGVDTAMTNYQEFYDLHLQGLGRGSSGGTKETTAESWNTVNLFQRGYIAPEDVANGALFLASDESRQVTGHVLPIDAGALTK
jgi:SDR family mycofactocin-dependent oxidoreductase